MGCVAKTFGCLRRERYVKLSKKYRGELCGGCHWWRDGVESEDLTEVVEAGVDFHVETGAVLVDGVVVKGRWS